MHDVTTVLGAAPGDVGRPAHLYLAVAEIGPGVIDFNGGRVGALDGDTRGPRVRESFVRAPRGGAPLRGDGRALHRDGGAWDLGGEKASKLGRSVRNRAADG